MHSKNDMKASMRHEKIKPVFSVIFCLSKYRRNKFHVLYHMLSPTGDFIAKVDYKQTCL